jgi:Kef-type K+ transport system membrane component KefB/mannitol/fructose-specific phosphotransferase system IIA component (Ntr-type)
MLSIAGGFSSSETTLLLLSIGLMLAVGRALGELSKRLGMPALLGEIVAGILLGPSLLGRVFPEWHAGLFPTQGSVATGQSALKLIAICLYLLMAGMEVNLRTVWRQGRAAVWVSGLGLAIPFLSGFLPGWYGHDWFVGEHDSGRLVLALFLGTALAISALPVIVRTLIDLRLYKTDLGMLIVAAAIIDDLTGWIIFAWVLGLMGSGGELDHGPPAELIALGTLGFAALVLGPARLILRRIVPWVQDHGRWPGAVMSLAFIGAMFGAAATEFIGIHAVFGAFLFGVALGDSSNLREETRATMERFIAVFFAPLFFVSIGLRVDFVDNFDALLTVVLVLLGTLGKLAGCTLGGRIAGLNLRESLAVAAGMNARGAMEIILGTLALEAGLIGERLFVALVVLALVTSLASGPTIAWLLRPAKQRPKLLGYSGAGLFLAELRAREAESAIGELAAVIAKEKHLPEGPLRQGFLERERALSTGLPNGIAVPHLRWDDLPGPVIALGISRRGIDFNTSDGLPVHLVVLILTPTVNRESQLAILGEIASTFPDREALAGLDGVHEWEQLVAWYEERLAERSAR